MSGGARPRDGGGRPGVCAAHPRVVLEDRCGAVALGVEADRAGQRARVGRWHLRTSSGLWPRTQEERARATEAKQNQKRSAAGGHTDRGGRADLVDVEVDDEDRPGPLPIVAHGDARGDGHIIIDTEPMK